MKNIFFLLIVYSSLMKNKIIQSNKIEDSQPISVHNDSIRLLVSNKLSKSELIKLYSIDNEDINDKYKMHDNIYKDKATNSTKYHVTHLNSTVQPSSSYNSGYEFGYGNCDNDLNCFLPYGICINETTCMCMPEYANVVVLERSQVGKLMFCSYYKKKVIVAAMLELFLPLALGHFYAEQYMIGFLKITYNFLVYSFGYVLYYKGLTDNSKLSIIGLCIVLTCIIPFWNLLDVVLFFTYGFYDGYGVPMS